MIEDITKSKITVETTAMILQPRGRCSKRLGATSRIQQFLTDGIIATYQLVSRPVHDQFKSSW